MPTSQEVENLLQAIEESSERGDLEQYFSKMRELQDLYTDQATEYLTSLNFMAASEVFKLSNEVISTMRERYIKLLDSLDEGQNDYGDLHREMTETIESCEADAYFTAGFANFSLGQANKVNRNPGDAIEYFELAGKNFMYAYQKNNVGIHKILADYSNAVAIMSKAFENYFRNDFNTAKTLFKQAKIRMERVLEVIEEYAESNSKDAEVYENFGAIFGIDYRQCEILYYFSDYKDEFSKGNYTNAFDQAKKLCDIFDQKIRPSLEALPKPAACANLADYHNYCAHKYWAEGEILREKEKWDESMDCYKKAKDEWENSGDMYLRSGLPQGPAMQEQLMNYASEIMGVSVRQCRRERELKTRIKDLEEEIDKWKQSLTDAVKPAGIKISNRVEAVTTVQQNIQLIQALENNVRGKIGELVTQLDKSDIGEDQKNEIKKKANEVLRSEEHGHTFLERVRKFTGDVSEIVKNIGAIAKPIAPFITALSLLL